MKRLVSVIVPVYNSELYLKRCINSIVQQSYKNLEIILINDGSTDFSLSICNEFQIKDSRIKLINKKNEGVSAARNQGIAHATGDYIGFVDSDDWIEKDYYYELVEAIEKNQATISVCGYISEDGNNKIRSTQNKSVEIYNSSEAIAELFKGDIYMGHLCNKLYKSEIFVNNLLNEQIDMYEDLLFNVKAMTKGEKVVFIPTFGYHYIRHPNSSSAAINDKYFTVIHAYKLMKQELEISSPSAIKYFNKSQIRLYIVTAIRMVNSENYNKEYSHLIVKSLRELFKETSNKKDFGIKYLLIGCILLSGFENFKCFYKKIGVRYLNN